MPHVRVHDLQEDEHLRRLTSNQTEWNNHSPNEGIQK